MAVGLCGVDDDRPWGLIANRSRGDYHMRVTTPMESVPPMSVKVMAQVWDSPLPPNQRLVLLAYADHANDDGTSVYPGESRMVTKTGYSAGNIRKITAALIRDGWLYQVAAGRRGQRAAFTVNVRKLLGAQDDTQTVGIGYPNDEVRVSESSLKPLLGDTPNHHITTSEPSVRGELVITTTDKPPRKRDYLWEVFTRVHGEPATRSERGKYNRFIGKLREATVDAEEYPVLVSAYVSKYGLQPAAGTIANERVGEMRQYRDRGPIVAPDADELVQQRIMAQHVKETK